CFPPDGPTGVCSPQDCFPLNTDCAADDQCCTGRCDPTYFVCGVPCQPNGSSCANDTECCNGACQDHVWASKCSVAYCEVGGDCWWGTWVGGTCAPSCPTGTCDHDACEIGGSLDPTCSPCAASVCDSDPFCCCGLWDSLCVQKALTCVGGCTG